MRLRLLRNVRMAGSSSVELLAGSVVNTTPDVAEKWQKQGIAMEDKSMDGGIDTKVSYSTAAVDTAYKTTDGEVIVERKIRHKRRHVTGTK